MSDSQEDEQLQELSKKEELTFLEKQQKKDILR